MTRKMHTWADNTRLQRGFDLIEVASDGSLDEGDAIIRTTTGDSILSGGTEYFAQLDREEAYAVIEAVDGFRRAGAEADDNLRGAMTRVQTRAYRVLDYIEGAPTVATIDYVYGAGGQVGVGTYVVFDPTGRDLIEAATVGRVVSVDRDSDGVPRASVRVNGSDDEIVGEVSRVFYLLGH